MTEELLVILCSHEIKHEVLIDGAVVEQSAAEPRVPLSIPVWKKCYFVLPAGSCSELMDGRFYHS